MPFQRALYLGLAAVLVFSPVVLAELLTEARVNRLLSTADPSQDSGLLQDLLSVPDDPNGANGFREFSTLLSAVKSGREKGERDVQSLYKIYDKQVSRTDQSPAKALAHKLFCKLTYPYFLKQNPPLYMVEDTLPILQSAGFLSPEGVSYFRDEVLAGQKHLLRNAETSDDFLKFLHRANTVPDWIGVLPRDRMDRIAALAQTFLSAQSKFQNPAVYYEALLKGETRGKDPEKGKPEYRIDRNDILMKMVELLNAELQKDPSNTTARGQLDYLMRTPAGSSRISPAAGLSRFFEEVRRRKNPESSADTQNDVRRAKGERLYREMQALNNRAKSLAVGEIPPSGRIPQTPYTLHSSACQERYSDLSRRGFYSISAPD